jgi:hypothetical protein
MKYRWISSSSYLWKYYKSEKSWNLNFFTSKAFQIRDTQPVLPQSLFCPKVKCCPDRKSWSLATTLTFSRDAWENRISNWSRPTANRWQRQNSDPELLCLNTGPQHCPGAMCQGPEPHQTSRSGQGTAELPLPCPGSLSTVQPGHVYHHRRIGVSSK